MKKLLILIILIAAMGITFYLLQPGEDEAKIKELIKQTAENIEKNRCEQVYRVLADGFVVPELNRNKEDFNRKTLPLFAQVKEVGITRIRVSDITENSAKATVIAKIVDATLGYYSTWHITLDFVKLQEDWFFIFADAKQYDLSKQN